MFSNVAVAAAESEEISAGKGGTTTQGGMMDVADDNSPSASTISTKASYLAAGQQFYSKSGGTGSSRQQSRQEEEDAEEEEDGSSPHRMIHSAHQLLSLSSSKSREENVNVTKESDDDVVVSAKRRKLSDLDQPMHYNTTNKGPSPTMALDGRVMAHNRTTMESPAAASARSAQSQQSLDLGAIPSWESAGKPLGGWSVNSGMTGDATLLGTAFSFSDSINNPVPGGRTSVVGAKHQQQQQEESDNNSSGDDPSPKSILSKVGEKRKSLAPGTHVQFSRDAGGASASAGVSRKRVRETVVSQPPPPPPPEEYDYYYAPRYPPGARPVGPPPHSRHPYPPPHGYYPAEEVHYGHGPPPPYGYAPPPPHRIRQQQHHRAPLPPPPGEYPPHTPSSQHPEVEVKREEAPFSPNAPASATERTIHKPQFSSSHGDPGSKVAGGGNWTKEEDAKLLEIMRKVKNPMHYEPLAKKLNNACGGHKSGGAVKDRWTRYLKPGSRKGQWTDEEDAAVVNAVTNSTDEPFTRWSDLALTLPGRVGKQVRDRWVNHLNPSINHNPFSREDVSTHHDLVMICVF